MPLGDPIYQAFLAQLHEQFRRSGLTQEQVAERLQVDQSTVSKILSGQRRLDVGDAIRVARALGVSLPEILPEVDNEEFGRGLIIIKRYLEDGP